MVIIKKPCNIKGKRYEKGAEFKPKKGDMPLINKMNERGFIEPLTKEELLELANSFKISKNAKKEGEEK